MSFCWEARLYLSLIILHQDGGQCTSDSLVAPQLPGGQSWWAEAGPGTLQAVFASLQQELQLRGSHVMSHFLPGLPQEEELHTFCWWFSLHTISFLRICIEAE